MRLHANIDHVATLRNARGTPYPDPVFAAQVCELAGVDGITAHLREDRRHIRDADLKRLKQQVHTLLNVEMAATDEMIEIMSQVQPDVITLVPERREERTTEGGLDVVKTRDVIRQVAAMCKDREIKLSLFIEADEKQVAASKAVGAQQVELHTGEYANLPRADRPAELERLARAARRAQELELEVAAGHGLTRDNVVAVCAIPQIEELNIGHALISDALFMGFDAAVRAYRDAMNRGLALREPR